MAKYIETAMSAGRIARELLDLIPDTVKPEAAELIAKLANMVVRCAPRGVQHTVRLKIVETVVDNMPVVVGMVKKEDEFTKRTYHALYTVKKVNGEANGQPSTEGHTEE